MESARLLGVEMQNNFSWDAQVQKTVEKCSQRLGGLYKISREVSRSQKKQLAESPRNVTHLMPRENL